MQTPARIDEHLAASVSRLQEALEQAWRANPETRASPPPYGLALRRLVDGFGTHYRRLSSLPRRSRRSMQRSWKRTLGAIALLMTLGQLPAWAATLAVSPGTPPSINADGKCSLIEAIVNANRDRRTHLDCVAGAGADTILLPTNSQQTLKRRELLPPITSRIVVEGRGSTIRRNTPSDPNFPSYLTFISVNAGGDLTLNRTTVTGALTRGNVYGLGISNAGRVTLNDSHVADTGGILNSGGTATFTNSSVTGTRSSQASWDNTSGIQNTGTLTLTNSVVSGNGAGWSGGGISNRGTATLIDSRVSENRITYEGGGGGLINSASGILTLVRSTVSDNSADYGGGIDNLGVAKLVRSTVSANRATYHRGGGGGILNRGTLELIDSTVSGNDGVYGAGLLNSGTLLVVSSTVTGNGSTFGEGGGVLMLSGTATLRRSIVSGNTTTRGREINNQPYYFSAPGGVVVADEFNLFGHDGDAGVLGFVPGSTDIVPNEPISAILLPLADNGGGTKTHALAIGSPALDASPDDANCPATDQRGNPRPRGPACDIGSFEGVAVLCNGKVTTMVGTVNDDRLTGTAGADVISGLLGSDTVDGLGGNDVICAGSGNDVLNGGAGADLLLGEPGDDRLFGQGGNDTLNGGVGNDRCDGGTGAGDTVTTCEAVNGVP